MDHVFENEKYRHPRRVLVYCPASETRRIEEVYVRFVNHGGPFPLPCNGCESMHGGKTCEECRAAVTLLFFHNPDIELSGPITPKLPPPKA